MAETSKPRHQLAFRYSDAGGIVFFANYFDLAHDAYESLILQVGILWSDWFAHSNWAAPIRHTEADYFQMLRPGEAFHILGKVEKLGDSSVTTSFLFCDERTEFAKVTLVAVFLNRATKQKTSIPKELRSALESAAGRTFAL